MARDGVGTESEEGRSWPVILVAFLAMVAVVGATVAATRPDPPAGAGPATVPGAGPDLLSYAVAGPTASVQAEGGGEPTPEACRPALRGAFRLAFYDDFDGSRPDPAWWTLYDSAGNGGFGLRRPAALAVADGLLTITAAMVDGALVSGGMENRVAQTYGRYEARVRTDPDPSGATSGVVLTWPASGRWPVDGETDIYETGVDPDRRPFSTFVHYGRSNNQEEISHDADGSAWHDMAMEWTPDRITVQRDGEVAGMIVNPAAIPRVPHHLTLQLDAWADAMGAPVRMQVDRVRIYRWEEGGTC